MNSKTRLSSPSFSECEIEILESSICLNWAGVLVQYFKKFTQRGFFHKSFVYYSLASQVLIVLYTLVWNDPFNFLLRFLELGLYSELEGPCSVESYIASNEGYSATGEFLTNTYREVSLHMFWIHSKLVFQKFWILLIKFASSAPTECRVMKSCHQDAGNQKQEHQMCIEEK